MESIMENEIKKLEDKFKNLEKEAQELLTQIQNSDITEEEKTVRLNKIIQELADSCKDLAECITETKGD